MQALINSDVIRATLMRDAPWAGSHGAEGDYLGMGLLYYALVYSTRATVAVCLGSGGGFVPRLMRQAQRDLGVAHRSRTILVDGNLPDAGWGAPLWLEDTSFFRQSYPDVELVIQPTQYAAKQFFAPNGIRIDYLHIDADHSFRACLDDFNTYRPFMRAGALVTFHDTHYPGAGVRYVIDHLRGRSDCELIDLVDQGTGLGLVRICQAGNGLADASDEGSDDAVRISRKPHAIVVEPPWKEWKYLSAGCFQSRNVLAAHFLKDCPTVVEIGGWRNSIDRFLTGRHRAVLVVDPLIRDHTRGELNGAPCRVRHIGARFQDLWWQIIRPGEYGLAMLGLDMEGLSDADTRVLWDLIDNAKTTVVEFPTSWAASRTQYDHLRAHTHVCERIRIALDLSNNDFGDLTNSWPARTDREMHVLDSASTNCTR
jgi:methyltransferase family protein